MLTDDGLRAIADYARGIGAEKSLIYPARCAAVARCAAPIWSRARTRRTLHGACLDVPGGELLPADELRRGDAQRAELSCASTAISMQKLRAFYAAGVDGVFSDFPAAAVAARA